MRFALLPSGTVIALDTLEVITRLPDQKQGAEVTTQHATFVIDLDDYQALMALLKEWITRGVSSTLIG